MLRRALMANSAAGSNTDTFSTDTIALYTLFGSWSISAGFLNHTATSFATCRRTGISTANGVISCSLTQAGNAGIVGRWQDSSNYYVAVVRDASSASGAPNTIQLYKRIGGGFTSLGSSTISFTRDTEHTLSLALSGTSIIVSFDGVSKINTTDNAIAAAGQVGLWGDTLPNKFNSFTWP